MNRNESRKSKRKQLNVLLEARNKLLSEVNNVSEDDIKNYRALILKCVEEKRTPTKEEVDKYRAIFEFDIINNRIGLLMPFKHKVRLIGEYKNQKI